MVDRRWAGVKGRKNICAGRGTKSRSNTAASRYRCRRTWRKVKDDRASRKELLVARDDEGSGEVCGGM